MKFNIFKKNEDDSFSIEEYSDVPLPHCDQSILHAPGECPYCDRHPYEQRLREHWRINFTGHHDESKAPCPSTYFRSDEIRDRWPGNRPEGYTEGFIV